jgi:Bacterial Ig-like domain (group 3)
MGQVKFFVGTTAIGTATMSGGVAKLARSTFRVGTHSITAEYLGNATSAVSTSTALNQVVQ